jgi:hypothetical protein
MITNVSEEHTTPIFRVEDTNLQDIMHQVWLIS